LRGLGAKGQVRTGRAAGTAILRARHIRSCATSLTSGGHWRGRVSACRSRSAFAAGHPRVLVATDVAARGIHVDNVDLVVHFDPPNDHKDYLHRSGRTARAGATGMVIALVERGQVRDLQRLHDAAGVTAASDEVATGHHVVRQIATSGTPVPPAPPAAHPARVTTRRTAARSATAQARPGRARPQRGAIAGRRQMAS
jgi:superfamily II DNA/RNA helicase